MAKSQSSNQLIELKKKKAIESAIVICTRKGVKLVKVNFDGCDFETGDQLAHYHDDEYKVCISERQLHMLNFEEIEDVMAHELAHIGGLDHSPKFDDIKNQNTLGLFRPPPGVVLITARKQTKQFRYKPPQIDKTRCNYHLCRKQRKLTQCKYCKNYYCSECIDPFEPGDKLAKKGHPCTIFFDVMEKKRDENNKKYQKALGKLVGKKPEVITIEEPFRWSTRETKQDKQEKTTKKGVIPETGWKPNNNYKREYPGKRDDIPEHYMKNDKICPKCGEKEKITKLIYGYVIPSKGLKKEIKEKKVRLMGCIVTGNDPDYYCRNCKSYFGLRYNGNFEKQKTSFRMFLSVFLALLIIASVFLYFNFYKEKNVVVEPNIIENKTVIEYPILDSSKLTDQQIEKAKMMTPEAQMKEFGGVLLER
jgi:hypothetical protein